MHTLFRSALALSVASAILSSSAFAQTSPASAGEVKTLPVVKVTTTGEFGTTQNLDKSVRAGALGGAAQKDTPFSSVVVTDQQILELTPIKLGDLFFQDASVSDNSGAYTAWGTYLTVRGMDLDWQNSYRIDGKPFLGYTVTLPYEHMEQVELLKGATGFMYGFGAPGGLINYVTKKPTDTPVRDISFGYSSSSILRTTADFGGRVGDGAFGYRVNAAHEKGDTTNDGSLKRSSFLLAFDGKIDRLSWEIQTIYQDRLTEDTEPTIQTRALGNALPDTIKNDEKLVGPGNYVDNEFAFAAGGLRYRFNDDWQLQTNASQSYSKTRRNESVLALQNAAGDYLDHRADYGERYRFSYWDTMLQGRVQLAGMTHNIVTGLLWQKQSNDDSSNSVFIVGYGTGNLSIQNTNRYESVGSFDDFGLYRLTEITQKSVFASDRIELNDRWSVLGGLRWIDYEKLNWSNTGTTTSEYQKDIVTPTVALMYDVSSDTMAYLSYVESLEQGSTISISSGYSNGLGMLDPLTSKQWELGIKKDGASWSGTAALFQVKRTSEYDRSCGTGCVTRTQGGESVFQGLELGATAFFSDLWSLGGNLLLLNTEYASNEDAIEGNDVAGAPRAVATAQLAYRVPEIDGLQLHLKAKYNGKTELRADNSLELDAYTLASLGATYDTRIGGQAMTFRANVNNLLNKEYWMYQYQNYIKAGDSRSLNLSATLHF